MIFLIIMLVFLVINLILYRTKKKRVFKTLGVSYGIISMLLYFLIINIGLASTPVFYKINNQTNKVLKTFSIVFYPDLDNKVIENRQIKPNEILASSGFEMEGSNTVWVVTTTKNNTPFSLDKLTDNRFEDQTIIIHEDSNHKITESEEKRILTILRNYRLKEYGRFALISVNLALIVLLLFRREL